MASRRRASRSRSRLRPGAGAHGQAFGLHQRLDVGLDPRQRVRVKGGPQLRIQIPQCHRARLRSRCAPGSRRRTRAPPVPRPRGGRGGGARPSAAASGACCRRSPRVSRGANAPSTASRMRSAVRRPTPNSAWMSSSVTPLRRPCIRIASSYDVRQAFVAHAVASFPAPRVPIPSP